MKNNSKRQKICFPKVGLICLEDGLKEYLDKEVD